MTKSEPTATLPGGAGRPADAELTRRILEATTGLVREHGYNALRIEHVARLAGCGKTAVYRRYPDKPALVAAAIRESVSLGDAIDTGALETDLLEHALQNQANQPLRDGRRATGRGMQAMFEPEVFAHLWDDFFRLRRDRGRAIIERAAVRGEIPADADADLILDTIAGLTLYRQSIKQIEVGVEQYRAVIAALIADPPRRARTVAALDASTDPE